MIHRSITITAIINGGWGLGRLPDGRFVMVRLVLPGETVTVAVEKDKKKYLVGRLLEIEQAAPGRTKPFCRHYGVCGGCDLQHGSYEAQLAIKRAIVTDLLHREEGLAAHLPSDQPAAVLPSPVDRHYRQRIRLQVTSDGAPGFRMYNSHEVVAIEQCPIARQEINTVLERLQRHALWSDLVQQTDELELAWNPATGKVTALCMARRKPRPADAQVAATLVQEIDPLERLFTIGETFPITALAPRGCDAIMSMEISTGSASPIKLGWEVGGFCQVNLRQNERMVALVSEMAAIDKNHDLLDLFCGMGNFAIPLASGARSVLAVEGQGSAVRSGKRNAERAGLNNAQFVKSPIHAICSALVAEGRRFDRIIVDPPRQGVPGLAEDLIQLAAGRMIYISCDPATLCRDLAALTRAGLAISRVVPVDMFPQTHHIETVVLLEKR